MFSSKKILTFLKKKYIIYIENKKRGIHMDMNDIIARLKNGEDAQAIADEMAKSLNDAVKPLPLRFPPPPKPIRRPPPLFHLRQSRPIPQQS